MLSVKRFNDDGSETEIVQGTPAPAIFFDNADYPIWVEFSERVTDAAFGSMLRSDNERFAYRKRRRILSGFINFGNDIGRSEIAINYEVGGAKRRFTFGFDVLSTKLNYHEHWRTIVEDIEAEYSMLSLDYMRRTFHGFSPDTGGARPDLVWWSIFEAHQQRFIAAVRNIIERPRKRLHGTVTYLRADMIRRIPPGMENRIAEHRNEADHLYRVEQRMHSNDTQENRFLKHALTEITRKYDSLKRRIDAIKNTSDTLRQSMDTTLHTMLALRRNPFFRTVGRFKGLTQESLVLQNATGYSDVYRTWNLLRRAYSLNEGMYRLQSKDIATLYEIWCFIKVSHIVKEQLGVSDDDVDHRNRMEMNGLFTWELGKGANSRILFRKDGVELAELVYNPKHTATDNDSISISNIVVRTVPQKPDIVLRLTKDDIRRGMKMTYLFDAKYRIDRNSNGVDYPPEDAINQMHRYRDAIYYQENADAALKKEVVGGYILFPGTGEPLHVQEASFYKSIREVNIGAFPLRPKDEENRELLDNFIRSLLTDKGRSLISDSIPQKGLFYTHQDPKDDLYMILTIDKEVNDDLDAVLGGRADTIIMGQKGMEEVNDLQAVRYIAPITFGGHITGYYRVTGACLKERAGSDYPIRIQFDVTDWTPLLNPARFGMTRWSLRGVCKTKDDFFHHCMNHAIYDKI